MTNSAIHPLAQLLERHEETGNAETARKIGGEIWERGDALVISSKSEFGTGFNFACRIRSDEAQIAALIEQVSVWFVQRKLTPHFRVNPLTRPANLARIFESRGLVCTETETQMVLAEQDIEPSTNPRVAVETVQARDLDLWMQLQNRGFGFDSTPASSEMARITFKTNGNTLYLARLDGKPVAASVMMNWASANGIYGVATLQEARGQGVGTALVRRMIHTARAANNLPVCLQAETGSQTQRWYERLGFRVVYDRTGWTLQSK